MEDILTVYTRPYDPRIPVICMDETSKQLTKEARIPLPCRCGQPRRYDYEYERNRVANLFMFFEPFQGHRHVAVSDHRKKRDWAQQIQILADEWYPDADKIVLVLDNLNTHTGRSMKCSRPLKPGVSRNDWKFIILQNMAAGSIWPRSN